jgi:molybdate transport system substrate-binding protein
VTRAVALLLGCVIGVSAGCGDGSGDEPTIRVSAAASLKNALEDYAETLDAAEVSYSFAGSDELAAQIRAGARPDVYAAANTRLPGQLHSEGLVEKPVPFAANALVIAVPTEGEGRVRSLSHLARSGVRIAAGSETVPVGSYTRKVLAGLPPAEEQAILANIGSNEPDVAGVVGKVSQRAVDAGFVYVTDVRAAGSRLRAITIPPRLQPDVVYGAAVVKGTKHPDRASQFVDGLTSGAGSAALRSAGFGPPPG